MNWLSKLWRKMFPKPRWGEYRIFVIETNAGVTTYQLTYPYEYVFFCTYYNEVSEHASLEEAEDAADKVYAKKFAQQTKSKRIIK